MISTAYISKISCYLPSVVAENEMNRLTKKTGILRRHIAADNETAADLAACAVARLGLSEEETKGIDYLLFCTQSPDYILPTTACVLHKRLGLATHCGALDFNMGCSGYVYGLSLAKGLIESQQARRVLLLTGETYSKHIHPEDMSTVPLFGDAGTATLIDAREVQGGTCCIGYFSFGTDGGGANHLIIPSGGCREPSFLNPLVEKIDEHGNKRSNYSINMVGAAIGDFALQVVPPLVEDVLQKAKCSRADVNYFVFHQANKFMLQFLQQACDLLTYPFWNDASEYGNTVSNSIPLALHDLIQKHGASGLHNVMLAGFGVGLSWAGCMVDLRFAKL
ncbi:3-oxoacyl-ACP synthase III family protein [Desulfovibrio cuneatus]|uniref:3-oxoacyl-ACP synthase III family protein n=1 Tax=Desulfovibrio cuneatus TaxID=159728 RepID=UPI000418EF42|nr:ketoacyl-ACP synthase III [Desulfovibrio cuneatus]